MNYYSKIQILILIESCRSQGFSDYEINEAFTLAGLVGKPLGYAKNIIGNREHFVQGYNTAINKRNTKLVAGGHLPVRRWGEKTYGDPAYKWKHIPDIGKTHSSDIGKTHSSDIKKSSRSERRKANKALSPVEKDAQKQARYAANKAAGLARQESFHAGKLATGGSMGSIAQRQARDQASGVHNFGQKLKQKGGREDIRDTRAGQVSGRYATTTSPEERLQKQKRAKEGVNSSTYYGSVANLIRESFQLNEKKGPCWKGYEAVGMKMKGGRKVPNCVPKSK